MDIIDRIGLSGLIPVVVIDKAEDAELTAKALIDGGIDIMEITMRTPAGLQAITNVRNAYPDMLVGAGTVLSVEKAKEAVGAGAQFIVSPGFNPEVVQWCLDSNVPITPGCVTPTEIEKALSLGLKVLKFFPADLYGGVKGCSALYGPYKSEGIKFIPTGGVYLDNLADFAREPFIHAVGGGFLCKTSDIANHNFAEITRTAKKAVNILLGFEFDHMGINESSKENSLKFAEAFEAMFGLKPQYGNSSNFAGNFMEVTNSIGYGEHGHIGIKTNHLARAIHYLASMGVGINPETAKYKGDKMVAVYLAEEFAGFAVHLVER